MSASRASRRGRSGAIAAAAAAAALVALVPLSRLPGAAGDEAAFLAPLAPAAPLAAAPPAPAAAVEPLGPAPLAPRAAGDLLAPEGPPLAARLARTAAALPGLGPAAASRLPSALAAALLAALVALLAGELAGPVAAALAPGLLLAAPRLLDPFLHAGPRPLGAALLFAAALAYRRSAAARTAADRVRSGGAAGILSGLAMAVQLEAALLPAVLAAHAVLVAALRRALPGVGGRGRIGATAPERPTSIELSLRGVPVAVAALLVVGPAVALALWPWLWPDPLHRLLAEARVIFLQPRPPWGRPLATTALALPAAVVAAGAAGVLHALLRLRRALRGGPGLADELFLLLGAAWPLAAAQLGLGPGGPGLAAWLPAFPFLAVLAARAIVFAARATWQPWSGPLAGVAGALAVAAAAVATAHAWPRPGCAWGELAGGAPGAASRGLERQDGEAVAALLPAVAARARPGARVHLADPNALTVYQAWGWLRADLVPVATPEEADLALVPLSGRDRAAEYRVWAAFGTATPVEGAFLDEVPLAWIYARPGAWR